MLTSPRFTAAGTGRRLRSCLCLLLLGYLGCAPALQDSAPAPLATTEPSAQTIAEKIATTRRALEQSAEPALQAELLLTLALLHTHPNNPAPDHARALYCLRQYAQYDPQAGNSEPIRRLTALLATLTEKADRVARITEENQHLETERQALERKVLELERSNRNMKAVIEKLKNLDIGLERRRNRMD